jgi:hypothetical protein
MLCIYIQRQSSITSLQTSITDTSTGTDEFRGRHYSSSPASLPAFFRLLDFGVSTCALDVDPDSSASSNFFILTFISSNSFLSTLLSPPAAAEAPAEVGAEEGGAEPAGALPAREISYRTISFRLSVLCCKLLSRVEAAWVVALKSPISFAFAASVDSYRWCKSCRTNLSDSVDDSTS